MNNRTVVTLAVLALVACSSSTTTTTTTEPPKQERSPSEPAGGAADGGRDPGSNPPADEDAAAPPDDAGECSGSTGQQACIECCAAAHSTGSETYFVALFGCICEPANCMAACEPTLCNDQSPKNPDAACDACMQQKNAACQQPVLAACTADADCVAFNACVTDSACTSKP